jgi:hypothetical protein
MYDGTQSLSSLQTQSPNGSQQKKPLAKSILLIRKDAPYLDHFKKRDDAA